jgi:hypothetical protein
MELDKNQIYIIDNFLNKKEQEEVLTNFYSKPLELVFNDVYYEGCHLSINSPLYTKMLPEKQFIINLGQQKTIFLEKLESKFNFTIDKVLRSKVNWIFREPINNKNGFFPPHIDNQPDHWVLLYYVCNSDGDTLMFEETQEEIPDDEMYDQTLHIKGNIEHKMGRGVLFHGLRYHCGLPPIESDFRITFNHNFTIKQ